MNTPSASVRTFLSAFMLSGLIILAAAPLALAQPDGGNDAAAFPAIAKLQGPFLEDVKQLHQSLLPTPAQLNKDGSWILPWEAPPQARSGVTTADEYWKKFMRTAVPVGLDAATADAVFDQSIAYILQHGGAQGVGAREGGMAMLMMYHVVNSTLAEQMDKQLGSAAQLFEVMGSSGDEPMSPARQKAITEAAFAPYNLYAVEDMKPAFVKKTALVRRQSAMTYYKSNNWQGLAAARSDADLVQNGIWYGWVEVNVRLVDERRVAEFPDLKDPQALEGKLNTSLRAFLNPLMNLRKREADAQIAEIRASGDADAEQQIRAIQEQLATEQQAAGRASLKVFRREFGENSYVIRMTGHYPETVGHRVSVYSGTVRNGPAITQIKFEGNFPEEVMLQEMDHFLSEMDARTQSYAGGLDGDLGGDLGSTPVRSSATSGATRADTPRAAARQPTTPAAPTTPEVNAPNAATSGPVSTSHETRSNSGPSTPADPKRPEPAVRRVPTDLQNPGLDRTSGTQPIDLTRATELQFAGKYKEAIAEFDRVLIAHPGNSMALFGRAFSKMWSNDLQGSLVDYTALAKADPNDTDSRLQRALLELSVGDPKVGRAEAEAIVRQKPNDLRALTVYAQAHLRDHDTEGARKVLARIIAIEPAYLDSLYTEANRYLAAGVPALAHPNYLAILWSNPQYTSAYFGFGFACSRLGYKEHAITAFEQYLRADGTSQFAQQARQELARLRQQ